MKAAAAATAEPRPDMARPDLHPLCLQTVEPKGLLSTSSDRAHAFAGLKPRWADLLSGPLRVLDSQTISLIVLRVLRHLCAPGCSVEFTSCILLVDTWPPVSLSLSGHFPPLRSLPAFPHSRISPTPSVVTMEAVLAV